MTLLGREMLGYLVASVVWVLALSATAALVAVPIGSRARIGWRPALGAGIAGAAVTAAIVVRFGTPAAWLPSVGGRPLPVAWSAAGALGGVAVALWRSRRDQGEAEPGSMSG